MVSIREAALRAFDVGEYKATVQVVGSLASFLEGVKVARNIPAGEMIAGRRCLVVFLDPGNPDDAAVVAVYS